MNARASAGDRSPRKNEGILKRLLRQVDEFNERHAIGAAVHFHPVIGKPAHTATVTESEAWILSGHTAVVKLKGIAGCVALDAVTEAPPPPETMRLVMDTDCPVCRHPECIQTRIVEPGGRPGALVSIECGTFQRDACLFKWTPPK